MQIVIHAGAHVTDEDRLIGSLLENADMLAQQGTFVPRPDSYRILLRDILNTATRAGASPDMREAILQAIAPVTGTTRLVLSNDSFFGTHKMAVKRMFYPAACARLETLRQIFAGDQIELFFAIRDPATFMPALLEKTNFNSIEDIFRGYDPLSFRWSEFFERVRLQVPDIAITAWCNEDTPLIWAEVVREMAGLDPAVPFKGEFTLLQEIMTEAGMKRFRAYLSSHPGMTEVQKRRVISAFLDKFAREDAVEEEYDLDGWTVDMINQLTDIYDEDVFTIQRIAGVNLIAP
ncbi:hypothetical protein [Roseovarius amoyensis]|uniref:hypothetical protein n=1 Tax=Roseovarius amoyensis TaxID=2211448 RepID=UPI000DBE4701|nr:hypothetical protein [Roseovarius amoyensis]